MKKKSQLSLFENHEEDQLSAFTPADNGHSQIHDLLGILKRIDDPFAYALGLSQRFQLSFYVPLDCLIHGGV